jgi:TPR repeat protein
MALARACAASRAGLRAGAGRATVDARLTSGHRSKIARTSVFPTANPRPRDFAAALKWYQEAWQHGADKWAAYRLGQFYENGWGVEKDEAAASFWNALASRPAAMCG